MSAIDIAIYVALGVVFLVLVAGILNLFRSGAEARSTSNKLMRARVAAQFVAILIIVVAFWLKTRAGG